MGCEVDTRWRDMPDGSRTCDQCGSLHPEDFIDILYHYMAKDEGYSFSTTTKGGWKFYAHRPGNRNASDGGIKFYGNHGTDEWLDQVNAALALAMPVYRAEMMERFGPAAGGAV